MGGTDIRQLVSTDIYQALIGANAPSALNVFATIADLGPGLNQWQLNGNTNGVLKYIGTNDNFDLPVYTNGAQVGIFKVGGRLDMTAGGLRALGVAGAASGTGVEVFNTGIVLYDYSLASYTTAMSLNALNIVVKNQGVQSADFTGGKFIIGKVATPGGRVDIWGSNDVAGTYALRVNGATVADILTVQNNGRIGINGIAASALTIAAKSGDSQFYAYSAGFNVSLSIFDGDAAALGSGTATFFGTSLQIDRFTKNVAIGAAVNASNKLFIKAGSTAQAEYIESANGLGIHVLGFTTDNAYHTMYNSGGILKVSLQTNTDSYFNGGKLGVGNTAPAYTLDVTGAIGVTGTGGLGYIDLASQSPGSANANGRIWYAVNNTTGFNYYSNDATNNGDHSHFSNAVNTLAIYLNSGTSAQLYTTTNTDLGFAVANGANVITIVQPDGHILFSPSTTAGGNVRSFQFTNPNRTNLTASSENIAFNITLGTTQYATGASTILRGFVILGPTISYVGPSTATDVYTAYINIPIAGTNATFTNKAALGLAGNLHMIDSFNIRFGTGTGGMIGTTTSEKIGFWGKTPIVRPAAYTPTNVTTDRSYDANSTTVDELADVLGTLIADLQSTGLIG